MARVRNPQPEANGQKRLYPVRYGPGAQSRAMRSDAVHRSAVPVPRQGSGSIPVRGTSSSGFIGSGIQGTRGFASVLRNRWFLRLWMAQLISQTIMNAANYGLIILVTTQVQSLTATSGAIVAFSLPALLFGAPAGVLVDRMNRRTVLWVSNLVRALVSLLFVVSLVTGAGGQLVPAYGMAFTVAMIGQFFAPAEGAAIPLLVHPDELINALSLFNVTFTLAQALGMIFVGPLVLLFMPEFDIPIGHHILLQVRQVDSLFLLIGLAYVVCAALIWSIPVKRMRAQPRRSGQTRPLRRQQGSQVRGILQGIVESWHFIRTDQCLLAAVVQLAFTGAFVSVIAMIAPTFVQDFFHQKPALAALVFVPAGAGLVLGSAFVPRIARHFGYMRTILGGVIALSLSALLLPAVHTLGPLVYGPTAFYGALPYVGVILVLTFLIGLALDLINVPAQTEMQERSPDFIKGRVLAVQSLLLNGVTIPFVLVMGKLADGLGLYKAIVILGGLMAVVGLTTVYFGVRGRNAEAVRARLAGLLDDNCPPTRDDATPQKTPRKTPRKR